LCAQIDGRDVIDLTGSDGEAEDMIIITEYRKVQFAANTCKYKSATRMLK